MNAVPFYRDKEGFGLFDWIGRFLDLEKNRFYKHPSGENTNVSGIKGLVFIVVQSARFILYEHPNCHNHRRMRRCVFRSEQADLPPWRFPAGLRYPWLFVDSIGYSLSGVLPRSAPQAKGRRHAKTMSEEVDRFLGIGKPESSSGKTPSKSKAMSITYAFMCLCVAVALWAFFKKENSYATASWMGSDSEVHTVGARGVSAFTYYFMWSVSQRKAVEDQETAGLYVRLRSSMLAPDDLAKTLPVRMESNLRTSIYFWVVAAGVYCFGRFWTRQ